MSRGRNAVQRRLPKYSVPQLTRFFFRSKLPLILRRKVQNNIANGKSFWSVGQPLCHFVTPPPQGETTFAICRYARSERRERMREAFK